VADAAQPAGGEFPFPSIETTISAEEWGVRIGKMLAAAARGERSDPYAERIPVRLWTPKK
jgi:hypothetical protein